MATIIFDKLATKLDGAIKAQVMGFLEKLSEDDTLPGLHIEPMRQPADARVRTGRVNQDWRAVLFKLTGEGEPHYLLHGVWPHDEAIAKARTITLTVNPINGQAMIRQAAQAAAAATSNWAACETFSFVGLCLYLRVFWKLLPYNFIKNMRHLSRERTVHIRANKLKSQARSMQLKKLMMST